MTVKPCPKENTYFALKVILTIAVLAAVVALIPKLREGGAGTGATVTVFIVYAAIIVLFIMFEKVYLVAHMKGNGVQVSERQFPEAYQIYRSMAEELGIRKVPRLFLLQEGGALNAFAVRFSGTTYVAIYSDIFALASSDPDTVRFILGHELGHVKRHHMSKRFWTFPSSIIPFLTAAYSRACEHTCDGIGNAFTVGGSINGLALLAAGKDLYRKIDVAAFVEEARQNHTAAVRFMGLFMSHPYLPRRLEYLSKNPENRQEVPPDRLRDGGTAS